MLIYREVFFLQGRLGGRFFTVTRPEGEPQGKVVVIPPFAEEMNKSRRMLDVMARDLAAQGFLVAQVDLLGTGDSAGDFGDAAWCDWLDDVSACVDWLDGQRQQGELTVLALRAGCLLACDWLRGHADRNPSLLFWQPVANGKQFLTQFLRLKAANAMLGEQGVSASVKGLRTELESGLAVEVAGYTISPDLACGLEQSKLSLPDDWTGRGRLFEVLGGSRSDPSPWMVTLCATLQERGLDVAVECVKGLPFWQSLDVLVLPELIEASHRFALSGRRQT